jgi:hypothetical protein
MGCRALKLVLTVGGMGLVGACGERPMTGAVVGGAAGAAW